MTDLSTPGVQQVSPIDVAVAAAVARVEEMSAAWDRAITTSGAAGSASEVDNG